MRLNKVLLRNDVRNVWTWRFRSGFRNNFESFTKVAKKRSKVFRSLALKTCSEPLSKIFRTTLDSARSH
ncbi:hypothetical protein PGT21_037316 [Puccinia graminis f. sp. tritici]|uniref:Uncharacterized protein n=1 Tax=Puccinia graminis f. sp. tritici TaxID=56615 RepID=A0A5B0R5L2_PUCGR|nr:hypothetical protein PGT21_037316 [Puccinia graminis f. sp. tritici]